MDFSSIALPTGINNGNVPWTDVASYTPGEWESFERAGCVFLPVTGLRNLDGGNIGNHETTGYYWSSSTGGNGLAYCMNYNDAIVEVNYLNRAYGCSVRLVSDAN